MTGLIMLSFTNNTFNHTREIHGFTKYEILEIKEYLMKLKAENVDSSIIHDYIKSKLQFSTVTLELYSKYLKELSTFVEIYIKTSVSPDIDSISKYVHFEKETLEDVRVIANNLQNLSSNIRNIKRITKNTIILDDSIVIIDSLLEKTKELISSLNPSSKEANTLYDENIHLWVEINRIKNLSFKLNEIPSNLRNWNEISELKEFISSINDKTSKKRKKDNNDNILIFHFNDIYEYFLSKEEIRIKFYSDLIHILHSNKIFEEYHGEEFINVLERKEIAQNLMKFIQPLVTQVIEDCLHDIIQEFEELTLKETDTALNFKELKNQKISNYLPKIVDYYILGLERKFQETINDVNEAEKFEEIANYYYNKIDSLSSRIADVDDWVIGIETYLSPYDNITSSFKKIFSNVSSEIYRRKNEYLTFIKTVKDEELRIQLRKFVSQKINEVNDLIRVYEDEASLIIKEEFPQLKRINEILNEYYSKIQNLKDEVFKKLDSAKSNDVDMYQIIRLWEDNFNRKKQQLTFLISLLINKLFKNFKELIDKEGILFATITEITEQTENFEGLPLNFALSAFLAEKLTEDELKERISEINSKINQLNNSLGLYQVELSKLETILTNRVKLRRGISSSDVQCTVCHKYINFVKDKIINCPFCGSTYHYLCVAFWLSKYNSCPLCQNHFLEPYSAIFENGADYEL